MPKLTFTRCCTRAALMSLLMLMSLSQARAGTAFVHLFEWSWPDIAQECEDFLGPKGFDAVQISPPQEHVAGTYWWTRYQPVSFTNLTSRSGTEAELQDMIDRCHAAGVKIYADVVMNNWGSWQDDGNYGSGGDYWAPWSYPDLSASDFHSSCTISDYTNAEDVWYCGLYGMPDLDTSASYAQSYAATYLQKLSNMGVDGFRIDAAKHMRPSEINSILSQAGSPWVFLEVIGASGEASEIQPDQYTYMGLVTEFAYGTAVAGNFNNQIKYLGELGTDWGLLNSSSALVFIDNHDRERGHGGSGNLNYTDGATYNLANVYMLAYPYGYPKVMSGYAFTDTDAGPPSTGPQSCANGEWVCQHRWGNIANMVGFRNATVDAWSVDNWWDNDNNAIAFGRGALGFVFINNESYTVSQSLYTGLPAGEYCDILRGEDECSGTVISVDSSGYASFSVDAYSASAIHVEAMADGSSDDGSTDDSGDDDSFTSNFSTLYFRGTANSWGSTAMTLVADNTWQATITFDGEGDDSGDQRFKFDLYADWASNYGDNDADGYLDLTGADISTDVVGEYLVTVNDSDLSYSLTAVSTDDTDDDSTDTTVYAQSFSSLYARGTFNDWGCTALSLTADNTWTLDIAFDGSSDSSGSQRYKVDLYCDWSTNYGDNNSDGYLDQTGADIYTSVTGTYTLTVNDSTLAYSLE